MCSTMPKLMEGKQFEQCMKGMKGKKGKKMRGEGGAGSSEEQGGGGARSGKRGGDDQDRERPESDVAPGDGQLEAMSAPRSGKLSRGKREPRRGDR
jgi:hypothetical protein